MKLLIVEDDRELAHFLGAGFRETGHEAEIAFDGVSGQDMAQKTPYDVLIIDRRLPAKDGLSLVRDLRADGCRTPIIFLTTLDGIADRVEGLEAGGDDYLSKPFAFPELLARVHALARRPPMVPPDAVLRVRDLEMDLIKRTVTRAGQAIHLLPQEFKLLEYFLRNAGRTVTRAMLLEHVWGFHFDPRTSVVETHISRLRAKVDKGFASELIQTVRGTGYIVHEAA